MTAQGVRRHSNATVIEALQSTGGIVKVAAQRLRVARQTLHDWIKADPELMAARDDIRNELLDVAEAKLLQLINEGSERSIHFFLDRIGRDRGYGHKTVVAGAPGEPLQVQSVPPDLSSLTQDERDALRSVVERLAGNSEGDTQGA